MQNKINNKGQDAFSEMIRQKLENHTSPVDTGSWDEIEARLKSNKKKVIPFRGWITGGAAVAALALLFTLLPLHESNNTTGKITPVHQAFLHPKQLAKLQSNKTVQPVKITGKQTKTTKIISESRFEIKEEINARPGMGTYTEPLDTAEKNEVIPNTHPENENNIAQNNTVGKDSVTKSIRDNRNSLTDEPYHKPIAGNKARSSWLLAAAFGSNGSVPAGNENYETTMNNKNIVTAATNFTEIMRPNDFQHITYNAPVSFGLIVRKNLNNEFSLESGLVYTYLLTTFENNGVQRNDARLHLHYIGIPLNLVVQIWNIPKWEIYVSGGGMLEKGIQSVYVQNQYTGNQTITTTAKTNIDGLQWSLSGAVGTTYKFQRNIGIFFEPKISYYFDSNQPLSARTEYPAVFGINAGVRFQIK